MEKKTLTQEDLDLNHEFVEDGLKVGDEIELGPLCNEDGSDIIPDEVPPAVEYDDVTTADATGPGGSDPSKPHGKLP